MKCRNTITNNVFEISLEEFQKLLEEHDCFEAINPTAKEKNALKRVKKKVLSIRDKVMNKNKESKK